MFFFSIENKNFQSSLKRHDFLVVSISSSEDREGGIFCTPSLFCSMKQYRQMVHSRDVHIYNSGAICHPSARQFAPCLHPCQYMRVCVRAEWEPGTFRDIPSG